MKIDTKQVHRIDYRDWEQFIKETYNLPDSKGYHENYSFAADVECGNDTSHEYNDITKAKFANEFLGNEGLGPFNRADLAEWEASGGKKQLWGARLLLLDCVNRDLIPEGDYIISVSW